MPKPLFLRRSSGLYVRFLVPVHARPAVGSRFIVRALGHLRGDAARLEAARLGYALAHQFEAMKRMARDREIKLKTGPGNELLDYACKIGRDGSVSIEATGPEDHALALAAWAEMAKTPPAWLTAAPVAEATAPATVYAPPTVAAMLGERIALFVRQFNQMKRAASNKLDTAFTLRLFLGLVGDKPLAAISAGDMDIFMDAIAVWPPNASKLHAFKDLTPAQVVTKAKKLGGKTISDRTQEKHLDRLRMFLKWCVDRREMERNWAANLHVMTRAQEEERTRRAYLPEELRLLFDPATRAHHCDTPAKWWIPLLALYSGARVRELSQLMTADVEAINGVWGYHIAARFTGQKLKNPKTRRFVPLHPALLAAGFVDYWRDVSARSSGVQPLFPGLGANPGDKVGDWWNRTYMAACNVTDPVLVFHCFRNTFATCSARAGVEPGRIARITGHSVAGSILHQHYIDAPTVRERAADVAAVQYEGLPPLTVYDPDTFAEFFRKQGKVQQHRAAKVARTARQTKK